MYCNDNPIMYVDPSGYYGERFDFTTLLISLNKGRDRGNIIHRLSVTQYAVDRVLGLFLANIQITATTQDFKQGLFYAYSNIGNGFEGYGIGLNINDKFGYEIELRLDSITKLPDLNFSFSIGNAMFGASIGISGIGFSFGLTGGQGESFTVGLNIWLGSIAVVAALVSTGSVGGLAAAAMMLFICIF